MKTLYYLLFIPFIISCSEQTEVIDIKQIPNSPDKIHPLKIGDKVPNIELKNINGETFNLLEYISKKPTIIVYYRGGWCLYCNLHLGQIHDIEEELFDLGYQILAISADVSEKSKKIIDKHNINYDLASDRNLKGAVSFGLAYNASKLYSDMIDVLEEYSGSKSHILPVPAAFIVDTTGIIRFEYINPDATIRISPNLLLSAAKFSLNVDKKKE